MPRRSDNPSPQQLRKEANEMESSGGKISSSGKNPRNVVAGKKGAASRKEHRSGRGR